MSVRSSLFAMDEFLLFIFLVLEAMIQNGCDVVAHENQWIF
jgi:hypothetical protein